MIQFNGLLFIRCQIGDHHETSIKEKGSNLLGIKLRSSTKRLSYTIIECDNQMKINYLP